MSPAIKECDEFYIGAWDQEDSKGCLVSTNSWRWGRETPIMVSCSCPGRMSLKAKAVFRGIGRERRQRPFWSSECGRPWTYVCSGPQLPTKWGPRPQSTLNHLKYTGHYYHYYNHHATYNHNHNHHTVQVTKRTQCACAWLVKDMYKQPPVQVAVGSGSVHGKSCMCTH